MLARKGMGLVTTCVHIGALLAVVYLQPCNTEANLPIKTIKQWAMTLGHKLYEISEEATALVDLRVEYVTYSGTVTRVNGTQLVADMTRDLANMLQKKVKAIRELVEVAEKAHSKHVRFNNRSGDIKYPKAKKLNTTLFELVENEHFNNIPVNLKKSTVHVPTNVYDESIEVLNGVDWSEDLDQQFVKNYQHDPTLTWQYFGSATGFFRTFPGREWERTTVDLFDCRTRGWYIQAATSPKDIVILLDISGSMKGLRMKIAKATVSTILDTLSDDDFFNVITFSDKAIYLCNCFNNTLVQANADNKKKIKKELKSIETGFIADFKLALVEAFKLLDLMNSTDKGANCNRAIMLITDGAPEDYKEIFEDYNWPNKEVRIFTYLIGREVGDDIHVKWMACANKGYYSHISTLADVQEHVQTYIHVLSRPLVIKRANHTVWTSVYYDEAKYVQVVGRPMVLSRVNKTIWTPVYMSYESMKDTKQHDTEGLKMMTSVAKPVFDKRKETTKEGNLLGVMGTDVPLSELTKLTPQSKLGVNGYAFAITNNGYVLFHPDFRPTEGDVVKPNYNSVDLAEVELQVGEHNAVPNYNMEPEDGVPLPNYEMKLRKDMIDRKSGNLPMTVKVHYDEMRRITVRQQQYFYQALEGTPFSLGIALPTKYGLTKLKGANPFKEFSKSHFDSKDLKLAPWHYCSISENTTSDTERLEILVDMFQKEKEYMEKKEVHSPEFTEKCDIELVGDLMYDAHVTHSLLGSWMKQRPDNKYNMKVTPELCQPGELDGRGIELVFYGMRSGLTRYCAFTSELTDPYFIEENKGTIEELYYKRAVENGEGVFTFMIPYHTEGEKPEERLNNTVVTAVTPILLTNVNTGEKAIAGVVGYQMKYSKFVDYIFEVTSQCPNEKGNCTHACFNSTETVACYLLDENGFIIFSTHEEEIGKFLGSEDGTMMKKLVIKEDQGPREGIFEKITLYDYQGLCVNWEKADSSASSIFFNPIKQLFRSLMWLVNEVALFLVHFTFSSWWPVSNAEDEVISLHDNLQMPGANITQDPVDWGLEQMYRIGTKEQFQRWSRKLRNRASGRQLTFQEVHEIVDSLRKDNQPRPQGYKACIIEVSRFNVNWTHLPHDGMQEQCKCNEQRSYYAHNIPHTNMLLLVRDNTCQCITEGPIKLTPKELELNESKTCERLQTEIYRRRPKECHWTHENEDSSKCGRGTGLRPSLLLTLLALLLLCGSYHLH